VVIALEGKPLMRLYFTLVVVVVLFVFMPVADKAFATQQSIITAHQIPMTSFARSIAQIGERQKVIIVETYYTEKDMKIRSCEAVYEYTHGDEAAAVTSWPVACPSN